MTIWWNAEFTNTFLKKKKKNQRKKEKKIKIIYDVKYIIVIEMTIWWNSKVTKYIFKKNQNFRSNWFTFLNVNFNVYLLLIYKLIRYHCGIE